MKLLFFLIITSCASLIDDNYLHPWIGIPATSLRIHPYFSKLPPRFIKRSEHKTWVDYKEPPGHRSSLQCESLGGCVGLQYLEDCYYEFEYDTMVILNASMHGECKKDEKLLP